MDGNVKTAKWPSVLFLFYYNIRLLFNQPRSHYIILHTVVVSLKITLKFY